MLEVHVSNSIYDSIAAGNPEPSFRVLTYFINDSEAHPLICGLITPQEKHCHVSSYSLIKRQLNSRHMRFFSKIRVFI